jgi:hypothetical protein
VGNRNLVLCAWSTANAVDFSGMGLRGLTHRKSDQTPTLQMWQIDRVGRARKITKIFFQC